jgi:uncharacterized protein YraI
MAGSVTRGRRWLAGGLFFLAFALTIAAQVAPAAADKRVALVIGNSAYRSVAPLDNPRNDARLIADTLHSLGFALVGGGPVLDVTKDAMDDAVQKFGEELVGADVGLFYYAGHGVQVRGANYLVPVDANPTRVADVDFQMLDANLVLRQMEGAGTRLNLVILDACRNNPFGGRGLRSATAGLAQMQAPEGTLISFATQPGNVALDGRSGNSPFSLALAQTIRKPGLGIFDAFNKVGLAVKRANGGAQQPWVSSSPIAGNFYFAPASASATTAPPAASLPPPQSAPSNVATAYWQARQVGTCGAYEAFARAFKGTYEAALAEEYLRANCRPGAKPSQSATIGPALGVPSNAAMRTYRVLDDVSRGILNMRRGAGTNHPIVAAIPAGAADVRVGRCRPPEDGDGPDWCEVQWRGFSGWASSCCMVPVGSDMPRTFRVMESVSEGILNVRRGPGSRHGLVVAMPAGASGVTVGRCRWPDDGGNKPWCEVEWRGYRGWASSCCLVDARTGARAGE